MRKEMIMSFGNEEKWNYFRKAFVTSKQRKMGLKYQKLGKFFSYIIIIILSARDCEQGKK